MQKLQLSIPEPCHESWQQMTPTEQGRFCNACAKEVIDFSMMTDTEVLNYFTKITQENVCGRALPSQLERTISKPKEPKKRLFWYWNYMVMFFIFFGKGNAAKAQGGIKPDTELSPVKNSDIRGEIIKVRDVNLDASRVITGKIMDMDRNPVSFASVKIKGTTNGVAADANGTYSMRINPNDVIVISGAGFKTIEVPVGIQTTLNTVLEKSNTPLKEVVVTIAGGVMRRPVHKAITESKDTSSAIKSTVNFEVKDDNTDLQIDKAKITIAREGGHIFYKSFSDKKGICEFKQFNLNGSYFVKVEAAGYEPNEFTIETSEFKDKKKPLEILLKKRKPLQVKSTSPGKLGNETSIRLGGITTVDKSFQALYVVDGTIISDNVETNPDEIEDIIVLNSTQAIAIWGILGSNGAIVITTRKAKEISLKEVVVNSGELITCSRMAGGISYTNIYDDSLLGDTIATVKTVLTNSIKIYPNPVQRNTGFSVALKLKQAGNYNLQVTDASGRIFLQQKFNASAKDHTEKISGDKRWAAGVYYIRIFDAQNKLVSKSSFVFQ
jgi:hypothetical protein